MHVAENYPNHLWTGSMYTKTLCNSPYTFSIQTCTQGKYSLAIFRDETINFWYLKSCGTHHIVEYLIDV